MKVVINRCYGGFGLSRMAILRYAELKLTPVFSYNYNYSEDTYCRSDKENRQSGMTFLTIDKPIIRGKDANDHFFLTYNINRADPLLVKVVEELGEKANGCDSELEVVEILGDIKWHISSYDGIETVEEQHRSW